jgi:tetratricopeptide (TPR) repeat protein
MMGIAQSDFSNGLSEVVCFLAEEATRKKESTWVVPYDKVVAAPIAKPQDAIGAFGINQVVIGNVQRFADQHRLSLQLCNAQDLSVIRSTDLDYDAKTCAGLPDSLAQRVAWLLDAPTADPERMAPYLPADPTAMQPYCRGLALMQNDPHGAHLDAAITSLQSTTTLDPDFPMGQASLGRAYTTQYQLSRDTTALDTAKAHLDLALSAAPDNVYSNIYAARVYFWMELYPKAIERCKAALAVAPGQPLATRALAWSYNAEDRFDEGASAFLASIRHSPDYWAAHFELGVLHYYRGHERTGLDQWKEALSYAPEDVTTLSNIGAIYQRDGEWRMAREYFERAYQLNRTCQTCQNMGLVSYFAGQYDEAAKYYTFALEYCDTTKYNTWGNLAGAQYYADGQRPRSIATYRRAIRLTLGDLSVRPEDPELISALIDYYTMSGDWDNGSRMIAYGDSLASDDADVCFSSAGAYERQGLRSTALRYLGNAIRLGYSIVEIERTPTFQELVQDPVFKRMISEEATGARTPSTDASSN